MRFWRFWGIYTASYTKRQKPSKSPQWELKISQSRCH